MSPLSASLQGLRVAAAIATFQVFGCGELPEVNEDCGNGVVEPGEDCDTYAPKGNYCRPPTATSGACHFDCSTTDCPRTAACGLDGICRYFTEEPAYVSFGQTLPVPAQSVRLGDFDGDGRQDLLTLGNANPLWMAYPRLQFFDDRGYVGNVFDPRIPISAPSIVALKQSVALNQSAANSLSARPEDQRQQIVFTSSYGIGTFDVATDKTVLPIAYPIQQLPQDWLYRMVRVKGSKPTAETPYQESVLILMSLVGATAQNLGSIQGANSGIPIAPMPASVEQLAGEPVAANLIDGANSPCEEVLLTFRGDSQVYMLAPCDEWGQFKQAMPQPPGVVVTLDNHTTSGSPLVTLADPRDGHLDIVLSDDSGAPYITFGNGDGTFAADPSNRAGSVGKAWPIVVEQAADCTSFASVDGGFPLALGDLNNDGLADWVSPGGIQLTRSLTVEPIQGKVILKACRANAPFVGSWSNAEVGDLNGDGLPDVVAGSLSEPDLDFLQGTGLGFLNPSGILTKGPLKHLIIGDFDGDRINDVAFTEQSASNALSSADAGSTSERLAIAFGNASGPPSAPSEIGQFSSIEQLAAANYAGDDSIDELGVIAQPSDNSGQQLYLFIGTPGRHPVAPLGLWSFTADNIEPLVQSPLASVVGNIVLDGKAYPSLVTAAGNCSSAVGCKFRIWVVPGNKVGGFEAPIPSNEIDDVDFLPYQSDTGKLAVALVVGDTNQDAAGEAFALTAGASGNTANLWRIRLPKTRGAWTDAEPTELITKIPGRLGVSANPMLVDLDGDNALDLVLILIADGHPELGILWNDGTAPNGQFSRVELSGEAARGFAIRRLGDVRQLVAITDGGVYEIASYSREGLKLPPKRIDGLPGGVSIGSGDLNGDGLPDWAIADPSGVQLFVEKQP